VPEELPGLSGLAHLRCRDRRCQQQRPEGGDLLRPRCLSQRDRVCAVRCGVHRLRLAPSGQKHICEAQRGRADQQAISCLLSEPECPVGRDRRHLERLQALEQRRHRVMRMDRRAYSSWHIRAARDTEVSSGLTEQSRQQLPELGVAGRLAQPPSPYHIPLYRLQMPGFSKLRAIGMQGPADPADYLRRKRAPAT